MAPQRKKPRRKKVNLLADRFVVFLFFAPLIPASLTLFGEETLTGSDFPGLAAIAAVTWTIGVVVAWKLGGLDYVAESVCFGLLLAVFGPWLLVLFGENPSPRGSVLARVFVASVVSVLVVLIVARRFRLWPFEDDKARAARHRVTVVQGDPPDNKRFFMAICECDWMSKPYPTEGGAFEEGRKHTPNVDSHVARPAPLRTP